MHIITGQNGYLLSHLLPYVPLEGYCYHFGCPIDSHSSRNRALLEKHINDTKDIIKKCRKFNLKMIYASSMTTAAPCNDTQYKITKILVESMLDPTQDLIWRIPRILSLDRKRGLLETLRSGKMYNPNNTVEFVHINDFRDAFVKSLNDVGVYYYKGPAYRSKIKDVIPLLESIESNMS